MDTTEIPTPQPGCDGDPLASITQRWSDLLGCTKSMCAVMRAFNASIDIGYAPMGLGEQVWAELTTLSNLVDAARISITPAIVASGRWKTEGSKTPEEWMANKTGSSTGKARSQLETGKNLRKAPGTQESFLNGEISAEQANTIADAVETNPAAEDDLLDQAKRDSLKNLKDEAARRKAEVEDIEERERRVHRKRYVRQWTDQEGAWNLRARGPLPTGSNFMAVLEGLIDQQFKKARKAGVRGTRDNYAYDALMDLANQHGWETGNDRDQGGGSSSGGGTGRGSSGPQGSGGTGTGGDNNRSGNNGDGGRSSPTASKDARPHTASRDSRSTDPFEPAARSRQPAPGHSPTPSQPPTPGEPRTQGELHAPDKSFEGRLSDLDPNIEKAGSRPQRHDRVAPNTSGGGWLPASDTAPPPDPQTRLQQRRQPTPRAKSTPIGTKQRIFCVDWATLARGRIHPGERCELRGLGTVSVSTIRRALTSGTARMVVTDTNGQVVTVARIGTGAINGRLFPMGSGNRRPLERLDLADLTTAEAGALNGPRTVIVRVRQSDLAAPAETGNRTSGRSNGLANSQANGRTIDIPGVGLVDHRGLTALLGDELASRLAERGQAVRAITHTGRAPSTAQRVALAWADITRKVPGCHNQRVEIDHRNPWAADRVTELDNLDPLCGHHHSLKTHEGWAFIEGRANTDYPQFVPPSDPRHPKFAAADGHGAADTPTG